MKAEISLKTLANKLSKTKEDMEIPMHELFHVIINDCNTYADVENLIEQGILTVENVCSILENFEDCYNNFVDNSSLFDHMSAIFKQMRPCRQKKHRLI